MTTPSKTCAKSASPTKYTQKSKLGISGTLNQCILSKIHMFVAETMTFDKNKTQRLESKTWPLPDTIFDLSYVIKENLSPVMEVRHFD